MKYLKSLYRSEPFYMEILGEVEKTKYNIESCNKEIIEDSYIVKMLPNQNMQMFDKSYIRKSLIGSLYEVVNEIPKEIMRKIKNEEKQIQTLFDFL